MLSDDTLKTKYADTEKISISILGRRYKNLAQIQQKQLTTKKKEKISVIC